MQTVEQSKMDYKPVLPLLMSMALPPTLPMLMQSLYDITDGMFVTQIEEDALTAVSLAFPIQTLIITCSVRIGIGVNSYITRKLGEQNQGETSSVVTHGLLLSPIGCLLFVAIGSFAIHPFFGMLTDSAVILDDTRIYTYICVLPYFDCSFYILIEKVFQSMGEMIFPMAVQAAEAITSIIPDPIMILGLLSSPAMGVKGAAITTVIGQIFATSLPLFTFLTRKFNVKLDLKQFHSFWDTVRRVLSVGIPNTCVGALDSVSMIDLDSIPIQFSNTAVSVYGICYKLQTFVFAPASGLAQGTMPVMSYNYGVGSHERLLRTLKYAIMVTLAIMVRGCAISPLFPTQLPMLFYASEDMLRIGVPTLRIISISFLPATLGFILPALFQAMGLGLQFLIVFLLRQLYIALPLFRLFATWFDLNGIWYPFLITESITAGVTVLLFMRIHRKDKALSSVFAQQPSVSQEVVC